MAGKGGVSSKIKKEKKLALMLFVTPQLMEHINYLTNTLDVESRTGMCRTWLKERVALELEKLEEAETDETDD